MAEKYKITIKKSSEAVEMYNGMVKECLSTGEDFIFSDLYKMGTKLKKVRESIDPQTKEKIIIPAFVSPYCRFGKEIKDAVKKLKK